MLNVPSWVVVLVMVAHAVLAFLTTQTDVKFDALVSVGIGAGLVALNVLQSVIKPVTEAVRAVGRAFAGMPEGKPAKTARKRRK